jgi:hypothetical protein
LVDTTAPPIDRANVLIELHVLGRAALSRRVWQIWLSGVVEFGFVLQKAKAAIDKRRGQAD